MRLFILGLSLGTLGVVFLERRRRSTVEAQDDRPSPLAAGRLAERAPTHAPRPSTDSDGLSDLTRKQLYRRAQAARIAGRSQMSKAQLIAALRAFSG